MGKPQGSVVATVTRWFTGVDAYGFARGTDGKEYFIHAGDQRALEPTGEFADPARHFDTEHPAEQSQVVLVPGKVRRNGLNRSTRAKKWARWIGEEES